MQFTVGYRASSHFTALCVHYPGLIDEISVLIHPFIAGGKADPTLSDPLKAGIPELQVPLRLQSTEVVGNGVVWARYSLTKEP